MPARQLESFNWNLSYTLKLYATAKRTDTEGLRAGKDNKEGLPDTYALFRDELYAIIEENTGGNILARLDKEESAFA